MSLRVTGPISLPGPAPTTDRTARLAGDLHGFRVLGTDLRFLKLWAMPASLRRLLCRGLNRVRPNLRVVGNAR